MVIYKIRYIVVKKGVKKELRQDIIESALC